MNHEPLTIAELHGEFGKAIYRCKKKLFADSKAGVDLYLATETFVQTLGKELDRILETQKARGLTDSPP
ncbi:MAG TPA: hypothetical protein VJ180_08510 [Pyrinomonadaceae bacterium]|nr:hypothetical protein [Pyrinomonadaceae bacterium]